MTTTSENAPATSQAPAKGSVTDRPAWKSLQDHYKKARRLQLKKLFSQDADRGTRLTLEAVGLFLDYSKNRITDETVTLLLKLAEECGLRSKIDAMFSGQKINITENRAVLHVALRAPRGPPSLSTAKTSFPPCTRCSIKWPRFRTNSARASGTATPVNAFAT